MKQINIFNEIDYIDAEGKIKRCLSCNKSIEKGKLCSCECSKQLIKTYICKQYES
jgi:hypothetical protein|tara:strand:- start:5413 stop:5577 length:165 start_codon:yes stop_codon:yes gene_type:complete